MIDDARLKRLAQAVADGTPVDWHLAESTAESDDERALVRQFKLLATLADVHRSDEGTRTAEGTLGMTWRDPIEPRERWGPLELRELVGRGGYGTVYRAWDPQLARDVALKLLSPENADDHTFEESVIAEGRHLARLRHPNVIAVYGADVHDGRVGFWMEFLHGETLKQWIDSHGRMNSREAALIGIDLCRALAAVHGAGLVHRDVKAQNVMREAGGRIVLMDFGTGAESGRIARLAGTPLYMAPELFEGAPATARSDVYSLGVLLFYLVSGGFPVVGTTLPEIKQAHASGPPRLLRDVRPDLPAAFVRVVDRALSPDPARRPATAGAFESELAGSLELLQETPAAIAAPAPGQGIRYALMGTAGLLLVLAALWVSGAGTTLTRRFGQPRVRSLAVLPLRNVAGEQDYFSEGMTDLLTTNLSKLKALKVISPRSVRDYQERHLPLSDIASALNVDAIVQGTVFRDGERLRVSAQLVSGADQSSLWAETYERDVRDAFRLQSDLARDIAEGINLSLTPRERSGLSASAQGSRNPQALDEYMKGWTEIEPRTEPSIAEAIRHFKEAIRLDPNYAQAYSSLAFAYGLQVTMGKVSGDEGYALARQAAFRAIDLDSSLASAYYSLGSVQFYHDWDWAAAASSLQHALDLDPNNAEAHATYGEFLTAQGRFDDALVEMKRARELDPMNHLHRGDLAMVYFYQRRFPEAEALMQEILSISTNVNVTKFMLGRMYADAGRLDDALALYAAPDTPHSVRNLCEWARVLVLAGRESEAHAMLRKIEANEESQRMPDAVAFVYLALGDRDKALQLVEHAVAIRVPHCIWLKVDPRFAALHGDPRFTALLRQIGFPEEG